MTDSADPPDVSAAVVLVAAGSGAGLLGKLQVSRAWSGWVPMDAEPTGVVVAGLTCTGATKAFGPYSPMQGPRASGAASTRWPGRI